MIQVEQPEGYADPDSNHLRDQDPRRPQDCLLLQTTPECNCRLQLQRATQRVCEPAPHPRSGYLVGPSSGYSPASACLP